MEHHYPKWLYHATKEALIVHSKEERDALGKGWVEAPVAAEPEVKKKSPGSKVEKESKTTEGDEA